MDLVITAVMTVFGRQEANNIRITNLINIGSSVAAKREHNFLFL